MKNSERSIVNPIALQNCQIRMGEWSAKVIDISFVRVVVEAQSPLPEMKENEPVTLEFLLDRHQFQASATFRQKGDGWLRMGFEKLLPSARAHLRSFLSPKKIGESLIEDWRDETLRHYHGLNESELWFDPDGGVIFTYLDQFDYDSQFLIRMAEPKGPLQVGKILRRDYMEMTHLSSELPLIPLSDREIYSKLGECRDIVTNFRPNGQMEYNLKQRLLKVVSDHLYSTSHKVEMSQPRTPRSLNLPAD